MNCITYFRLGDIRPVLCITEETRALKIGEFLLLLSGKIETKMILFYSFIYIT